MVKSELEQVICKRLRDYSFVYELPDDRRYPKLYTAYLLVCGIIKIRLGLKYPLRYAVDNGIITMDEVRNILDIILPSKEKE